MASVAIVARKPKAGRPLLPTLPFFAVSDSLQIYGFKLCGAMHRIGLVLLASGKRRQAPDNVLDGSVLTPVHALRTMGWGRYLDLAKPPCNEHIATTSLRYAVVLREDLAVVPVVVVLP